MEEQLNCRRCQKKAKRRFLGVCIPCYYKARLKDPIKADKRKESILKYYNRVKDTPEYKERRRLAQAEYRVRNREKYLKAVKLQSLKRRYERFLKKQALDGTTFNINGKLVRAPVSTDQEIQVFRQVAEKMLI